MQGGGSGGTQVNSAGGSGGKQVNSARWGGQVGHR